MPANPAVVVLGYERPEALQRLLASLDRAWYPKGRDVTLLISLDQSDSEGGRRSFEVARAFEWRFGQKQVVEQPQHLGVVQHFLTAGRYSQTYGDVILLEDDLSVSPVFYGCTSQMLDAYAADERVAGFCLYGLWFNGFTREPFQPIEDGADVFFLGVPYTQGLCFSARQWQQFDAWLGGGSVAESHGLHPAFSRFGPQEWFPSLAAYLAQTGRWFCFPRSSLTVGWGDAGAHFEEASSWFQTPLLMGPRRLGLSPLDDALAVYDGFFELLPDRLRRLGALLPDEGFDVDLNATKQPANLREDFVLTTRPVRNAVERFGLTMYPPELNVALQTPGRDIALAHREDVRWDAWAETEARRRLHAYAWRRHRPSRARSLRFAAAEFVERLRSGRSG